MNGHAGFRDRVTITTSNPTHSSNSPSGSEPGAAAGAGSASAAGAESTTSFWRRHRRAISMVLATIVAVCVFYYVLPRIVGLGPTLKLLRHGDPWWLVLGVAFEALSYAGAIVLFRGVFARTGNRIDWTASSLITLAGAAASKLVAAAGAGGIAVTVWALRGYGLTGTQVANGMVCFGILTYGVYMAAMAVAGYGLWFGLFSGQAPVGLTLIPAIFATVVILVVLSMLVVDEPVERFLRRRAERSSGRAARRWRRAAAFPHAIHQGLLDAIDMVRRRDPAVLGAIASWGFDIAVLWAAYHAFGHSPPGAVLVLSYYVGSLANVLPFPGGIGGVEGGMIGAFLGFGVGRHLAVLAVLAYRTISYWLPAGPGAVAYWRLRRRFKSEPTAVDADQLQAEAA